MEMIQSIPRAFVWRRLHSLMGLWLVLFLMEHLLVNSQAALWVGDSGKGFVDLVNGIHNLPYLQVIEVALLGIPIGVHLFLGVKYLFTSKMNSYPTSRNRAYNWQRITSWILLILLTAHVVKFRFLDYPQTVHQGSDKIYLVKLSMDEGLYTVADRVGASLYDAEAILMEEKKLLDRNGELALVEAAKLLKGEKIDPVLGPVAEPYDSQKALILQSAEKYQELRVWVEALENIPLKATEVIGAADDFGVATLLSVRDTFKNPIYALLYTVFVLTASFHAFNGLWTFLITWGVVIRVVSQRRAVAVAFSLMFLVIFLGLASIWGTYWANLRT